MPVIPEYAQRISAQQGLPNLAADLSTAGTLGLVAQAGEAANELRAFAQEKAEERAAVWANEQVMAQRARWVEEMPKRQAAASETAEGFTPAILKDYDAESADLVKGAPTKASQIWLKQRLAESRLALQNDALMFEARRGVEYKVNGLGRALDSARTSAEFHPDGFLPILAEQRAAIEASGLPAATQAELMQKSVGTLAEASVMGMIRSSPRDALAALNDEQTGNAAVKALEFPDRIRLRNAAEAEIRRLEAESRANMAEARESLRGDEADAFAAKAAGLSAVLPARDRYTAVYGAEGAQRHATASQMFEAYDVAGAAVYMPPDEAAAVLSRFQPKVQAGAADQAKVAELAAQLYMTQRKAFEADPAGTIVGQNPDVAQAFQAATAEGSGPQAVDAYVNKIRGAQEAAGIAVPQLLPKGAEEAIAQQLAPNPEKPGQRAVRLAQLEQQWGKHFPDVLHQVVPKLDGIGQILPFVPGRVAARLDAASANPKPILEALQQSGKKSDLELSLTDEFADFDATFPTGVVADGPAVAQQYRDAAQLLAAEYIRSGMAPNKAAKQAREELIDSQYAIEDTLRIPRREDAGRGRVVDTEAAADGTSIVLRQLAKSGDFLVQPSRFGTAATAQEDMRELVASDGFWVTNGDETGAVLALPDGIVLGADGQPIMRTWAQLEAVGREDAAKGARVRDPMLEGAR